MVSVSQTIIGLTLERDAGQWLELVKLLLG